MLTFLEAVSQRRGGILSSASGPTPGFLSPHESHDPGVCRLDGTLHQSHSLPFVAFAKGGQGSNRCAIPLALFFFPRSGVRGQGPGKASVFGTEKRRHPDPGRSYPWIVRSSAWVNPTTSTARTATRVPSFSGSVPIPL